MKWIKANERLPEFSGTYRWRMPEYKVLDVDMGFDVIKIDLFKQSYKLDEIEWLDESPCELESLKEEIKELRHTLQLIVNHTDEHPAVQKIAIEALNNGQQTT